jgi:hypothetical protein
MRHAKNFQPEWGYLTPAPSFMRTARIVLVAMTVGATAGAGVLLSLVDRPVEAIGETSVAARTARPFDAEPAPVSAGQAAQVKTQTLSSTAEVPANIAAMAEVPATADAPTTKIAETTTLASTPSVGKKATKWRRPPSRYPRWGEGSLAFLHPFNTRGYHDKVHFGWY